MLRCSMCFLPLALLVVGCGRGEGEPRKSAATSENKNQTAGENQPNKSTPKEAQPNPVIYSTRELAKVLDFSALPCLDGTAVEHKSAASASVQAPGKVPEVSAFYQKSLTSLGWELVPDPDRKNNDEYAELRFAKNGHRASLIFSQYDVSKDKGPQTLVSMEFHGNLDTRTLPPPADSKVLVGSQTLTSYLTEMTVADTMAWATKTLAADGWQKFTSPDTPMNETDLNRTLNFRKQGYALTIYTGIHPTQKKTFYQYMVSALSHELPTPPEATKVQFKDALWQLSCETPGDWQLAAEFYQKAMRELGYKPLPGEDPQPTYRNLRFGNDAGDVIMVQVSSKDQQTTQIHIDGVSAAMIDAIKKKSDEKKPPKK
jgi:hypothetical protein